MAQKEGFVEFVRARMWERATAREIQEMCEAVSRLLGADQVLNSPKAKPLDRVAAANILARPRDSYTERIYLTWRYYNHENNRG